MYVLAVLALVRLGRAWKRGSVPAPGALLVPVLYGFAAWQAVDVVGFHWLVGIHRVRVDVPNPLFRDVAWLVAFGVPPLLAAWSLRRRPPGGGTRATAAVLAAAHGRRRYVGRLAQRRAGRQRRRGVRTRHQCCRSFRCPGAAGCAGALGRCQRRRLGGRMGTRPFGMGTPAQRRRAGGQHGHGAGLRRMDRRRGAGRQRRSSPMTSHTRPCNPSRKLLLTMTCRPRGPPACAPAGPGCCRWRRRVGRCCAGPRRVR